MEFFEALGLLISRRWKAKNYNEEVFPEIASSAVAEMPPVGHVAPWDILTWALHTEKLPYQDDIEARFGDPPLTVFIGRKFRIEVLFWTQGLPSIHQHAFSGAFHVLHGSSLHCLWNFEPQEQIEVRLLTGRASFERGELLLTGDSRPIYAGNAMFHSTYHLDRPSISVVVRTISEANKKPQYSLLPPTIAHEQQGVIEAVKRQTQLLRMMLATGRRAELNQALRHLLATKDAYSVFQFLMEIFNSVEDEEEREDLLLTAKAAHPGLIASLDPALRRREMGNRILSLYGLDALSLQGELKFLLALLRNIPERAAILDLIRQRFPEREPITQITKWIRDFSAIAPNIVQLDDAALLMLDCLLRDCTSEDVVRAFAGRETHGSASRADLRQLCTELRSAWLLAPLHLADPFNTGAANLALSNDVDSALGTSTTAGDQRGSPIEEPATREWCVTPAYQCLLGRTDAMVPLTLRGNEARLEGHRWVVNPSLRFSRTGHCPNTDIPFVEAVTTNAPTAWVRDPITSVEMPFVLDSELAATVSELQPGRELGAMLAPALMHRMIGGGLVYDPETCEANRNVWNMSLERAREAFRNGYAELSALLHPFTLAALRAHFRGFIQNGRAQYGDKQTPRRWIAHNEPVSRFLLHQLGPIVARISGVPTKPSYVYFASYHEKARLDRHVDRPQCEFSLSMLVDYSPEPLAESPWPLWLDTKDGPVSIRQRIGDTLIYRGRELPHYRHELPADHVSTHLFFHYVPQDFTGRLD